MSLVDGTYTFTNVGHSNSKLDLFQAAELGPITGLNNGSPQKWTVKDVGNGLISIQNGSTPTSYVSVHKAAVDMALIGSTNPYNWVAHSVPGTQDTFYFTTADGLYTWNLSSDGDYAVIVLKKTTPQTPSAAKWKASMVKLLLDGTYTFTNVAYSDSKVGLLGGAPLAPVTGLKKATQKWTVKGVGKGQITVQNDATTSYASAFTPSEYIALTGSLDAYNWVAVAVPGATDIYYFTTVDGNFVWTLISDCDYAVIILKPTTPQVPTAAQWKIASA